MHDLEEAGTAAVGLANLKRIRRRRKGFVPDTRRNWLKPGVKKPGPQAAANLQKTAETAADAATVILEKKSRLGPSGKKRQFRGRISAFGLAA